MRMIDADLAQEIADRELTVPDAGTVQFVLSHTPTIEAEAVIYAKWEETKTGFRCSACHGKPGALPGGRRGAFLSKRCPYCGAKMDLKE